MLSSLSVTYPTLVTTHAGCHTYDEEAEFERMVIVKCEAVLTREKRSRNAV